MNKINNKFVKTLTSIALSVALTACGGSDKEEQIVNETVNPTPVNTAPEITSTEITTVMVGELYTYTLAASDAESDTLTISAAIPSELPWLTFDATTNTLSGTPTDNDISSTSITLTVSDGTDDVTQTFTIDVVASDNNAPTITSAGVTSAMVGEVYAYTLTATDADSDTLTMSAAIPNELSWLTFDSATGVLTGTPASGDVANTAITLTVNDDTTDTTQTFSINVIDEVVVTENVIDFEESADSYVFNNFDGGVSEVIANPQATGINTSSQVVQMQKFAGQHWGGSTLTLPAAVTLTAESNTFTMKVHSDRAAAVLFKLEGINKEISVDHTGNGWEELTYDFADDVTGGLTAITTIFDLGTMGDADSDAANWTFYYDDITTPAPQEAGTNDFVTVGTPFDFEAAGLGSDFAWTVFENEDNPALEFVANPAPSAVNDSATVAMFTTRQTGQPWAGAETAGATPVFTMDASNSIVKIMVYKTVISDVGLKFSVGAAAQPEIKVANTKINEWEELTFDFSSRIGLAETIGITSIIVFPDFSDSRTSDNVNYFDNLTFGHNQ